MVGERVRGRVRSKGHLVEDARVHAREGERADEGVGHDLEGERRHGLVVRRGARGARLAVEQRAADGVDVGGRRPARGEGAWVKGAAMRLRRHNAACGQQTRHPLTDVEARGGHASCWAALPGMVGPGLVGRRW